MGSEVTTKRLSSSRYTVMIMHHTRSFVCCLFALYAVCGDATLKTTLYFGEDGSIPCEVYMTCDCRFVVVPPQDWKVNLNPGGTLALQMTQPQDASVFINVAQVRLTTNDTVLTESDIRRLKDSLIENHRFKLAGETRNLCINMRPAWHAWGVKTSIVSNAAGVATTNTVGERHSYHIADGFLHHIWLCGPTNQTAPYETVFDAVCRSYVAPPVQDIIHD